MSDAWSEPELLAAAQELGRVGAWALDIATGEMWWSAQTYEIFGRRPEDLTPSAEALQECVHPDDREELQRDVALTVNEGQDFSLRHRVLRPDGAVRYVSARGTLEHAADGAPRRIVGIAVDVTDEVLVEQERDAALRELAASEERYRLLAENAWDVIWTMAVDGTITYVSPSVMRVRGITPEEAAAQTLDQIHTPDSAAKVTDYFGKLYAAMAEGTVPPIYHGEREYYRKDGSIMIGELQVIPQVDATGQVVQILGVTRDISEQRHFEDELNLLAVTDPLTGVWNRRRGEELVSADLAEARRYGPALSLLMLDIDHFKDINDTHGHQIGDRVLVQLTQLLLDNLRTSDVLSRWGGEEFVILMRHCTIDDAVLLAEKLRGLVFDTDFGEAGTVTVSIGAAELTPGEDLESWLRRADIAMYEAKAAGRNAVRAHA